MERQTSSLFKRVFVAARTIALRLHFDALAAQFAPMRSTRSPATYEPGNRRSESLDRREKFVPSGGMIDRNRTVEIDFHANKDDTA